MSRTVALAVRQTLEHVTGKTGRHGRANVLAAVTRAGGSDADRRLLQGIAYQWTKGRQLQEHVYNRVMGLLARLAPARAKALRGLIWTRDGEAALKDVWLSADWAALATPLQIAMLTRDPKAPIHSEFRRPYLMALPIIRENPRVARELDAFERWTEEHGHGKWVRVSSLQRALSPLVTQARTRGVLPGWEDLGSPGQWRFVRLSLEREKQLLGTRPLHLRAMQRFQSPEALRLAEEDDAELAAAASRELPSILVQCRCQQRYRFTRQQRVCPFCGTPPPPGLSA